MKLKSIAIFLAFTIIISLGSDFGAYASINDKGNNITQNTTKKANSNIIRHAIEKAPGTYDVVQSTKSTPNCIAVADGENSIIKIPKSPATPITVDSAYTDDSKFSIELPKEAKNAKALKDNNGTIVYASNDEAITFAAQALSSNGLEGVRALISINDPSAPKKYEFKVNLDKGSRLMTDSEYLGKEFSSGEIYIVNKENIITGIIDKPWAYDANGNSIPTYYKIKDGNKIVQVINFNSSNAFPIVADPSFWQVTKCVGAIAWALGSGIFSVTKVLKIKKYIKALGGLTKAVKLLLGASTSMEMWETGGAALLAFAAEISGVQAIIDNCF